MYLTVDKPLFIAMFQQQRPDDFSLKGLEELYDYLIEEEALSGRENKLDVVELTSSFAEVTLEQFNEDFQAEYEDMDELTRSDRFVRLVDEDTAIVKTEF
jgi:hypothetical protein